MAKDFCVLFCACVIFQTVWCQLGETCNTVDGGVGNCISINNCQSYLKLVQEATPGATQVLRKAHCGFEGNIPKVCCPLSSILTASLQRLSSATMTTTTTTAASAVSKNATPAFIESLPDPPVCGVSNATLGRVVGGDKAKLGDFPWMALLGYKNRFGDIDWLCGGSLISSHHVLTAAQCIHNHENDLYIVRLGELDLAREDEGATPYDVLIKQKVKHAGYNANAYTNDIGILILAEDVKFTDLIRPICIPSNSEFRSRSFEDYTPLIAGWGKTAYNGPTATHLQVAQLPVISNNLCSLAYTAYKEQTIDERVLCAGHNLGGKDACQGDSGGPLMQPIMIPTESKTYFFQIGIVTNGKKCAEAGFPGIYSRITHFIPWIEEQVLGHTSR
uniref:CLIP domain-containing serine protease n=1 Tax=Hyphantria cunea TaxID=39466 RepID=Q8I926_HYPCU|nr:coagulation factor-like protein 1 [Hyphantria cunea]